MLASLARRRLPLPASLTRSSWRTFTSTVVARNEAAAPSLSEGETLIHQKLTAKFSPTQLQVQDVSGGCGSFYAITIASQAFKGLPIVKQHKLVTETLKQEIAGIHGLQIKTITA